MKFSVAAFNAWAPGLESDVQWESWAISGGELPQLDEKPPCKAIKPMVRRRLTRWGRLALEVATACEPHIEEDTPTVFASRHGDTHRTYKLLSSISEGEALSPTAFSLSVHNSSSGIFSMEEQIFGPAIAVAAGKDTLGQAFVEAYSLLAAGQDRVLLVYADEPIADYYRCDVDEGDMPVALGIVLCACSDDDASDLSINFTGDDEPRQREHSASNNSFAIQFLSFWFSGEKEFSFRSARMNWLFER